MYGNSISELSRFDKEMNPNALPIPTPIFRLIRFLNENCLEAEGIFRLSGNQNEVDVERRYVGIEYHMIILIMPIIMTIIITTIIFLFFFSGKLMDGRRRRITLLGQILIWWRGC